MLINYFLMVLLEKNLILRIMSTDGTNVNKYGLAARVHRTFVSSDRAVKLAQFLSPLIENGTSVLDVGCGYGLVSRRLCDLRPDINLAGIDIVIRDDCLISASPYNGSDFPFPDNAFDYVQFVDVLHHTDDPMILLQEAVRVARKGIILKDHQVTGFLAWQTLWFLDWAGNTPYDIGLLYNFWTQEQWSSAFQTLRLEKASHNSSFGLYPFPFSLLFDRSLHFIDKLVPMEK